MKRIPGFPSLSPEIKSRLVFHFPLEPVVKGECDKISQDLYHILRTFLSVKNSSKVKWAIIKVFTKYPYPYIRVFDIHS